MSLYTIALFLHIVGALVLFAILTVEGVSLRQGFMAARLNRILGPISAATILFPGIYMVVSQWAWNGWVVVGIAAWVLIAVAGAATGIGLLSGRLNLRSAALSWSIRVGMALGAVFIMTVKPDLIPSVIVVVAGAVLGGAVGSAAMSRMPPANVTGR